MKNTIKTAEVKETPKTVLKINKDHMKKVWSQTGNEFYLGDLATTAPLLENGIYQLEIGAFGFYLKFIETRFEFAYKIYGLEKALIERTKKTYKNTVGNLGILLNGEKGTGKTVTSKILCNDLNQPVILISHFIEESQFFLNSIQQNITVLIDEYEKIYGDDDNLLTIMDGAMNSEYRRIFILTTNKLYINTNLLQRPGRIRYLKTFKDLSPEIIMEIVDDCLKYKKYRENVIKFISNLEIITVDIVKSIVEEVNIHNEPTEKFRDVFNVRKITGKHNVYLIGPDKNKTEISKKAEIYPRSFAGDPYEFVGRSFSINGEYFGNIIEVLNNETIIVVPISKKKTLEDRLEKVSGSKSKTKVSAKMVKADPITLLIENADVVNWSYAYGHHDF